MTLKNNNKTGLKTPENYFDSFSEEIKVKVSEEKIKQKFGNNNPFSVPGNYFENFVAKKENIKKKVKIIEILKPYLSIAAGLVIVVGLWQFILTKTKTEQTAIKTEETSVNNEFYFEDIDISEINQTAENYIYNEDIIAISGFFENTEKEIQINVTEEEISDFLSDYTDDYDVNEILASL